MDVAIRRILTGDVRIGDPWTSEGRDVRTEGRHMSQRAVSPSDVSLPPTLPIDMSAIIAAALTADIDTRP